MHNGPPHSGPVGVKIPSASKTYGPIEAVRLPSASKSALMLSPCLYWAGPHARAYDESLLSAEQNSKRNVGTETHKAIKDEFDGVTDSWQNYSDDVVKMAAHAAKYLEDHVYPHVDSNPMVPGLEQAWSELSMAIHWETGEGRLLHGVTDRKYPNWNGWQFGTSDLVWVSKEGVLTILDWKTGEADGVEDQIKTLLCAYRAATGHSGPCQGGPVYLNEEGAWPQINAISAEELDCHAASMKWITQDIVKGNTGGHNVGIHCTRLYCPHLGHCSAVTQQVAAAAEVGNLTPNSYSPLIPKERLTRVVPDFTNTSFASDSDAGTIMAAISAMERQTKYVKEALKKHITAGGKVKCGAYEWSEGGNGYRWRKN